MVKTLPISKVIAMLQCVQNDVGDLPLVMSSDQIGTSYGTFDPDFDIECNTEVTNGIVVLYPYTEISLLNDIDGYNEDDEDVIEFDCI